MPLRNRLFGEIAADFDPYANFVGHRGVMGPDVRKERSSGTFRLACCSPATPASAGTALSTATKRTTGAHLQKITLKREGACLTERRPGV
jgi:hypothetical protein